MNNKGGQTMYYSNTNKITPRLSENALKVLQTRYLRGETPEEMFTRVANAVAKAEYPYIGPYTDGGYETDQEVNKIATRFYNLMASLDFLPNSPTLMNAGRQLGQLAACFVVPVEDSMDGIFTSIKNMALIQKTGGGTGFSFSRLRPKGDPVSSTIGEASGPIPFMRIFNAATEGIKQGGARRGANMGILRVDHPDILEFINCKKDLTELNNFNISVGITDEFMDCLEKNIPFQLRFAGVNYAQVDPHLIWDNLITHAWESGEPGVIFLDIINVDNPTPELGEIESTNPCGEQPLLPYECCNLGSINLAHMIKKQPVLDSYYVNNIDWSRLEEAVTLATAFLDDIIDVNIYPLPEIKDIAFSNRKIGLGVMGFADLLAQLRIPYGSDTSMVAARAIMSFIQEASHKASKAIAHGKGVFPNWEHSVWAGVNEQMRNATTTTIAPTGTLSVIAGVSSGIEPLFDLCYEKKLTAGDTLLLLNPYLEEYLDEKGFTEEKKDKLMEELITTGTINSIPEVAQIFKTAHEIHPLAHVRMQAAFQSFTDNAVSKTINFESHVSKDDIAVAIRTAWSMGCKGITVYRDGSRDSQPLNKMNNKKETEIESARHTLTEIQELERYMAMQQPKVKGRPAEVKGSTKLVHTGCGNMFVTINELDGQIYEVFLKAGSTGGCAAFTEGTARLISIALRYGVPVGEIIDQLNSVRCDNFRYQAGKNPGLSGKSCPDVVGHVMLDYLQTKEVPIADPPVAISHDIAELVQKLIPQEISITGIPVKINNVQLDDNKDVCPDCGDILMHTEGCIVCRNCGYSHC
jgi:ribonucleoside-diphosphate reductase alpha chain